MTIYEIKYFDGNNLDDYIHICAEKHSLEIALTEAALWKAYNIHCGKSETRYCKKTISWWPLTKEMFSKKYWRKYLKKNYINYEEYQRSEEYVVIYEEDNDDGMCSLYSLLDNFHSYIGAFKWKEYIIILSVGSSYTHNYKSDGYYNLDTLSEGFSVIINTKTNGITLIALGEDDGNYWGEKTVPYSNLSIYDKGVISSIINDIDETNLKNKEKLIEKIIS